MSASLPRTCRRFRVGPGRALAVVAVACVLALAGPAPAAAHSTVTVSIAWGGVAACGVGFFIAIGSTWQTLGESIPALGPLLTFDDRGASWGLPLPLYLPAAAGAVGEPAAGRLELRLLEWRF